MNIKELRGIKSKLYSYRMNDGSEKKAKGTKNCVVKHRLTHENYKDCLFNCTATLRSQKRIKSYYHEMYTKEVNKVTLTSDDDKVLQTFNRIETYPYETTSVIVCESKG